MGVLFSLALAPAASSHHSLEGGHLPPVAKNLELIGELEPSAAQGPMVDGQIADLAVHENYAYLNSWDEPSCTKGGVYIVNIEDPFHPVETGFIPARSGYYHGEGAHVVSLETPQFTGDLLAVNNEACSNDETRPAEVPSTSGGFDLYDVTDPEAPVTLVQNEGDRSPEGSLAQDPNELANSYHSVFVWQDGPQAFLVGVDNTEFSDVDIYNITDPTQPELIADLDLWELFPQIEGLLANGELVFHHDAVVKRVGNQMRMLASYWDAGYVQLDVTNPANPTYITDTDFDEPDPLTGFDPPEGNAHQAEYSQDNELFLAADEDFAPDRIDELEITTGPNAGTFDAIAVGGSAPLSELEDGVLNGPTVNGGYGCDNSAPIPARATSGIRALEPGEEAIVVLQRGPGGTGQPGGSDDPEAPEQPACFPGEKAANGIAAGYDAVLLVNHHRGESSGVFCGSGDFPLDQPIVAPCTTHEAFHRIFGSAPTTELPYVPANEPDLGALGETVRVEASFDGWGYAHLYDADTSEELDAYAIPEALDPAKASGFGDLSIHEFATDPDENLAYSSYYSGGVRVFLFDADFGLVPTGAWIDEEGSNFWGIEQFTRNGRRLIAGSDRDFGIQILCYTGPASSEASRRPCSSAAPPASTPPGQDPGPGAGPGGGSGGPGPGPAASDTDPPQTTITKEPKARTLSQRATFRFRSDERRSSFQCKFGKTRFRRCENPFRRPVALGTHVFKVRAVDAAGNIDRTPAQARWQVVGPLDR